MAKAQKSSPPSLFQRFLDPVSGTAALRAAKARLEAFLAAVPGEYCGFTRDGSVIFSDGFAALLSLRKIEDITDIQNALSTSDAAVIEGQYYDLQTKDKAFSVVVQKDDDDKIFRLSGAKGQDIEGQDRFEILWLEDITAYEAEKKSLEKTRDTAERETRRLQNVMDTLPQMMWIRDGKSDITWCNQNYADNLGVTPAVVIAQQKEIAVTKSKGKDALKPKSLAQKALSEGSAQYMDTHAIMNGKRRLVHISETPLPGSGQTLGLARDITREEDLEKEIKRYTAANKELLEQLRTAIGMYGPEENLEFYNSAFAELWGLEEQWLNTKPKIGEVLEKLRELRRLPEQADFRSYKDSWIKMFTGLIDPHEDMMYLPDGSALRMLVIPNPAGGLITTFEDVTSRLELESSFNTLIAVQKETLDNLAEGVVVFGGDGRIKLWNPSFAKLWDLNPEDLDGEPHINKTVAKLEKFFTDNWGKQKEFLTALALDRKEQVGRIERSDHVLIEFGSVPLPDGGVLVSFTDITDSVKVEKALREKNLALETAEKLKLDFLANVSYQLRTPLNALMGFNEILDNEYFGALSEKQKEYTTGIQEAGDRLMNLINDILDLSSLEAGYMELNYDEFDVQAMLDGIYDLTQDWARAEKLDVHVKCPKSIGRIVADQSRLKQVFVNLIRNAIHFTPEGGTITISAATYKKDNVKFSVKDTGVGIPQDKQEAVFQPFERLEAQEQPGNAKRGAGLGLSLVRNIVELHGGSVDMSSIEDEGTDVTLILPLKPSLDD